MEESEIVRLSKKLANASELSRREASDVIKKGEVSVNGEVIRDPAFVLSGTEEILYKGHPVKEKVVYEYFVFNKAKNMNFSKKSDKNRPSVIEILKKTSQINLSSVHSISDEMCGLLMLTNDEEIVTKFDKKESVVKQLYELVLPKDTLDVDVDKIKSFIFSQIVIKCKHINVVRSEDQIVLIVEMYGFDMDLVLQYLKTENLDYVKLDRVYFGGITKKDISRGWFRPMSKQEIILLKHFYNPPPTKRL